ncbi:hypothetical protein GPN2_21613 [Streptomyces murinus]
MRAARGGTGGRDGTPTPGNRSFPAPSPTQPHPPIRATPGRPPGYVHIPNPVQLTRVGRVPL